MKRKFSLKNNLLDVPNEIFDMIGCFLILNFLQVPLLLEVSKLLRDKVLKNWMKFAPALNLLTAKWFSIHSKYIVNISDHMVDTLTSYPRLKSLRIDSYNYEFSDIGFSILMNTCCNIQELILAKSIDKEKIEKYVPMVNITMLSTYNWFPDLFHQGLTHLDLRKSSHITTLSGIEVLHNLVYLDVGQTCIDTIDHLSSLQKLKCLNIAKTWVTQIFNLIHCLELEFLCIGENMIKDLTEFCKHRPSVCIIPSRQWRTIIRKSGIIPLTSRFPVYASDEL
jgi:hypothetical protein